MTRQSWDASPELEKEFKQAARNLACELGVAFGDLPGALKRQEHAKAAAWQREKARRAAQSRKAQPVA